MTSQEGDDSAYRAEYNRLVAEHKTHPGKIGHDHIEEVRRAIGIWYPRSVELRGLLLRGEKHPQMRVAIMKDTGPGRGRDQFVAALDSTLNAYLAAMGTVVDVARRVSRSVPAPFESDYAAQSEAVRAIDGVSVLRGLRNYMLHYGSAPWWFRLSWTSDAEDFEVAMESSALLKWDGWNSDARGWLGAHESFRPSSMLEEYEAGMLALFQWFGEEFYRIIAPDIESVNDLVRRLNLHLTRGVTDGSDWEERTAHIQENLRRMNAGEPQLSFETGLPFEDGDEGNSDVSAHG